MFSARSRVFRTRFGGLRFEAECLGILAEGSGLGFECFSLLFESYSFGFEGWTVEAESLLLGVANRAWRFEASRPGAHG